MHARTTALTGIGTHARQSHRTCGRLPDRIRAMAAKHDSQGQSVNTVSGLGCTAEVEDWHTHAQEARAEQVHKPPCAICHTSAQMHVRHGGISLSRTVGVAVQVESRAESVGAAQVGYADPPPAATSPVASPDAVGLLWALSIVASIRLGRASSEADQLKLWTQVRLSSARPVEAVAARTVIPRTGITDVLTTTALTARQDYNAEDLIEDQTLLQRRRQLEAEEAHRREEAAAKRYDVSREPSTPVTPKP